MQKYALHCKNPAINIKKLTYLAQGLLEHLNRRNEFHFLQLILVGPLDEALLPKISLITIEFNEQKSSCFFNYLLLLHAKRKQILMQKQFCLHSCMVILQKCWSIQASYNSKEDQFKIRNNLIEVYYYTRGIKKLHYLYVFVIFEARMSFH